MKIKLSFRPLCLGITTSCLVHLTNIQRERMWNGKLMGWLDWLSHNLVLRVYTIARHAMPFKFINREYSGNGIYHFDFWTLEAGATIRRFMTIVSLGSEKAQGPITQLWGIDIWDFLNSTGLKTKIWIWLVSWERSILGVSTPYHQRIISGRQCCFTPPLPKFHYIYWT